MSLEKHEANVFTDAVRAFKRRYLSEMMRRHHGWQTKAAAELGVHRNTVRRLLIDLDLPLERREWCRTARGK